ncbi:MAG: helix-turn-helix domain-containing protein [Planctomycetales bacterium]|nr:helix-turn-helix domain-containing protein [Planctomycetales bacterium]
MPQKKSPRKEKVLGDESARAEAEETVSNSSEIPGAIEAKFIDLIDYLEENCSSVQVRWVATTVEKAIINAVEGHSSTKRMAEVSGEIVEQLVGWTSAGELVAGVLVSLCFQIDSCFSDTASSFFGKKDWQPIEAAVRELSPDFTKGAIGGTIEGSSFARIKMSPGTEPNKQITASQLLELFASMSGPEKRKFQQELAKENFGDEDTEFAQATIETERPQQLVTTEAAAYLGITSSLLRRYARKGRIASCPATIMGIETRLFDIDELDRFLSEERSVGRPKKTD